MTTSDIRTTDAGQDLHRHEAILHHPQTLESQITFKSTIAIVLLDKKNPAILVFLRRQIFAVAVKGIPRVGHVQKVSDIWRYSRNSIFNSKNGSPVEGTGNAY